MFASSRYINQPHNIRKSFLWRWESLHNLTKAIVNVELNDKIYIHGHEYNNCNSNIISNPQELALNHYNIMSKEYYNKVKMTRGDAVYSGLEAQPEISRRMQGWRRNPKYQGAWAH